MKRLILAGVVGASMMTLADAQTVVHITGSTAFRGATHNAIMHILGGTPNPGTPTVLPSAGGGGFAFTGTALGGASQAIFKGTVGGNAVIIETSWSGSAGGIQTVSQKLPVTFLADSTGVSATGISGVTVGAGTQTPDIAMADCYQGSTAFTSPVLVDNNVGVIPFRFVSSPGTPFSNITPGLAQVLWENGNCSLALFTGTNSDEQNNGTNNLIWPLGRNPDSGTRIITFSETGIGALAQVVQYTPTIVGLVLTNFAPWPVDTVNGITYPLGDSGYSSGGTLVGVMRKTCGPGSNVIGTNNYAITSLGVDDAANALLPADSTGSPVVELTYNGTKLEAKPGPYNTVIEGKYTFWGYEHLDYLSTLAGVQLSTAKALVGEIGTNDAPVTLTAMHVSRTSDGGLITQTY